MDIRLATADEYGKVIAFYREMIEKMQSSVYCPPWIIGVYPTDDYLKSLVLAQEMFIGLEGDKIVAATVLNHRPAEEYAGVNWDVDAADDEALIIHLLCVLPEYGGRGYAKQLLDFAKKYASETGQKALRLDAIEENFPAIGLYEGFGFKRMDTVHMYFITADWANFIMYEYRVE